MPDFGQSWPVEWVCAELSRLAYYHFEEGDGPRLTAALARAGFSAPVPFNVPKSGAQAFGTLAPDGTAFVAFRGTQPGKAKDFIADVRFKLVPWPNGGQVHSGFKDAFDSVAAEIDKWLERSNATALVATGHSLGASLATLLASVRPEADLVTFGSPRVGDAAFAATFAGRHVRRHVDCADGVTMVPPELLGYRHLEGEIYIDRNGAVHTPAPAPDAVADDQSAARTLYLRKYAWQVWRNVLLRELADHAPVNYISGATGRREPD